LSTEISTEASEPNHSTQTGFKLGTSRAASIERWIYAPLIVMYVVSVQFATVTRSPSTETDSGLSTAVMALLLVVAPLRGLRGLLTEPLLWGVLILLLYLIVPTAMAGGGVPLFRLAMMSAYLLVAASVSRCTFSKEQYGVIFNALAASLLISAFLTIVDFMGLVDVPYCNEITFDTKLDGTRTEQASGFFDHRSAMAAVFSIAITSSAILAVTTDRMRSRLLYSLAATLGLIALFLTHNRSGVLGSILVVGFFAVFSRRFTRSQRVWLLGTAGLASVFLLGVIGVLFPEHLDVYVAKLGFLGLADRTWESDSLRVDFFIFALQSLGTNPLGHGLSKLEFYPGVFISPHNVITAIIWAGGLFSLCWLLVYGAVVAAYLSRMHRIFAGRNAAWSATTEASAYSLLVWIVNGMTHQTLATGLAWLLLGLFLASVRTDLSGVQVLKDGA